MKTSYRIIKLSSGEEIIANIKGKENGKIILERPMIFKTQIIMNTFTSSQKEMVFLRDWIAYTNDNEAKVEENHITSIFKPDDMVIVMYDKAKEKVDENPPSMEKISEPKSGDYGSVEDMIREMLNMSSAEGDPMMDVFNDHPDMDEGDQDGRIYLNMDFSVDDLRDMVADRIISPRFFKFLEQMYMGKSKMNPEKISDEYTGEDTDHPDYGNRWTDWDSDLSNEDYK